MTRAAQRTHPPRLAAWLVDRLASAEQAESILGDLDEELSNIVIATVFAGVIVRMCGSGEASRLRVT